MELSIDPSIVNIEKKLNPKSQNLPNFDNFLESSLKISEIENKENEQTKKYDSINSYNFDSISNNDQLRRKKRNIVNIKKKLTKEDLNNIPLPIFSCIYCSNDKIAFKHLINENLSNKYFLQTSIYDMKLLDKLTKTNPIIDHDNQNPPLIDIILKNTEFIRHYYNKNEIKQMYTPEKMNKIFEFNSISVPNNSIKKLNYKLIRRKNKELAINKTNSNKLFTLNDYKPFFQKQNNNSTFTNDNITTNKNSITNTLGTGLTPNTGLSLSLNNNIINENPTNINNINICFNPNNMMQSIMENIEKNEESECESEEKFLDILGVQSNIPRKIDKNKIDFEEKNYDIWNPEITTITEEEDKTIKNKNSLQDKNDKNIKQKVNFVNVKKKLCKIYINDKNNIRNEKDFINRINYNYEKVINKKIKKNNNDIITPCLSNNIKKKNLLNFFNSKNRRNFQIDSALFKRNFSTKDYNNNIYVDKNIFTTRNKDFIHINNLQQGQRTKKNLLYLLKSKSGFSKNKKKNIIINSKKLISKSSLPLKDNLSSIIKSSLTSTNFYESSLNFNSKIYKNIRIYSNLSQRKDREINLEIDLNNKKMDTFSRYIKIPNRSLLKEKSGFTSLPNLKISLSPIYNKIRGENNYNKKIRIKNNLRKINSYNFLQKKVVSLSRPSIRCGIFYEKK